MNFDFLTEKITDFFGSSNKGKGAVPSTPAAPAQPAPRQDGLAPEAMSGIGHAVEGLTARIWESMGVSPEERQKLTAAYEDREERSAKRAGFSDSKLGAGKMIGDEWIKPDEMPAELLDPTKSVGSLETPEDRMKALNMLVQNDPNDPNSEFMCGATSVLAASLLKNGEGGAEDVMKMLERPGPDGKLLDPARRKAFAEMRQRMKKGDLTVGDMQLLKGELYADMKQHEEAEGLGGGSKGVVGQAMQTYILKNPEMAKLFADGKMQLNLTDTDGDATMNHYVLGIQDDKRGPIADWANFNTVFDPYARRGGQVVTEKDQVIDYNNAWHQNVADSR